MSLEHMLTFDLKDISPTTLAKSICNFGEYDSCIVFWLYLIFVLSVQLHHKKSSFNSFPLQRIPLQKSDKDQIEFKKPDFNIITKGLHLAFGIRDLCVYSLNGVKGN